MTKLTSLIAGTFLLGSSLVGCRSSDGDNSVLARAKKVHEPGQPKRLEINVIQSPTSPGLKQIFLDIDGDGKTVEQYVLRCDAHGYMVGFLVNLVRPGAKARIDEANTHGIIREMTPEEMQRLDKEYQRILGEYQRIFSENNF